MQYLEGEALKERIAGKPLETDELLELAIQIADGHGRLHVAGASAGRRTRYAHRPEALEAGHGIHGCGGCGAGALTGRGRARGASAGAPRSGCRTKKELNVDALIEGSVLRAGDRVRITAQLIQGSTDRRLRAESYERDLRDILALQSEVAQAITSEVKAQVAPEEQLRLASHRPVNNEKILKQGESLKRFGHFHHVANFIAGIYAQLNKPEQAVPWLEETAATGFPCYPFFELDHSLDPIRHDSRFVAFMQKLKPQWEYFKSTSGSSATAHGPANR